MTQIAGADEQDQPPSPISHYSDREENTVGDANAPRKIGAADPRLNAALLDRSDSQGGSLGDHVDYTRPLTVRNE